MENIKNNININSNKQLTKIKIPHAYPKKAFSQYIRGLADIYSQQNAGDYNVTTEYGAQFTNGKCFYCGKNLLKKNKKGENTLINEVQYDHILPASLGGLYAKGNVVIACPTCNQEKSNVSVSSYYQTRLDRKLPTLFNTINEMEQALAKFSVPYRHDFPLLYGMTIMLEENPALMPFENIENFFKEHIEFPNDLNNTSNSDLKIRKSPNHKLWNELKNKDDKFYQKYSTFKVSKIVNTVNEVFDNFVDLYNINTNIKHLSLMELTTWMNNCLKEKSYNSKSDYSVYYILFSNILNKLDYSNNKLYTYPLSVNKYCKENNVNYPKVGPNTLFYLQVENSKNKDLWNELKDNNSKLYKDMGQYSVLKCTMIINHVFNKYTQTFKNKDLKDIPYNEFLNWCNNILSYEAYNNKINLIYYNYIFDIIFGELHYNNQLYNYEQAIINYCDKYNVSFPKDLDSVTKLKIQFKQSSNNKLWYSLYNPSSKIYKNWKKNSIKDVTSRVGTLFNYFINRFNISQDITNIKYKKLLNWANNILIHYASYSQGEHSKYKRLLTLLFNQLNLPINKLLTYKQANSKQK